MTALLKTVVTDYTKRVFCKPAEAKRWLALSLFNRAICWATVTSYARDMRCGAWGMSDSNICFDWNGNLLNGHHRLWACIEAGVGVWFNVCYDMDPKSFRHMDRQKPRPLSTVLKLEGYTHTAPLAAATSMFIRYHQGQDALFTSKKRKISDEEYRETLEANPDIITSTEYLNGSCNKLRYFSGSVAVAILFHIMGTRVRGPEVTTAFFEPLNSGADLSVGNPIYALREKLQALKTDKGVTHRPKLIYGLYLPAWQAHVAGKRMVRMKPVDWTKEGVDITIR